MTQLKENKGKNCDFCDKIKKGIKSGYDGEKLKFPFYLTSYGIKSDDDEYNYTLNIKWNYCPICGVKID